MRETEIAYLAGKDHDQNFKKYTSHQNFRAAASEARDGWIIIGVELSIEIKRLPVVVFWTARASELMGADPNAVHVMVGVDVKSKVNIQLAKG